MADLGSVKEAWKCFFIAAFDILVAGYELIIDVQTQNVLDGNLISRFYIGLNIWMRCFVVFFFYRHIIQISSQ